MDGEGRRESRKGEGGGAEKISQKKQNLFARKRNQEKRKTFFTTQFCSPPRKKSCPKEKADFGGVPKWAEAYLKTY